LASHELTPIYFFLNFGKRIKLIELKDKMALVGIPTDWSRYVGKWYEQARIPSWFEPETMSDSVAEYVPLADGSIQVINEGTNVFGTLTRVVGNATVDRERAGTLKVVFFAPFSAPYVVLSHGGASYDMAVVGSPSREYLWFLTREPMATPTQWSEFIRIAKLNGYTAAHLAKIQKTPKTPMQNRYGGGKRIFVPSAWSGNIERLTLRNNKFRQVLKTGNQLQVVLMSIAPNTSIGLEVHKNVDQFFRIEKGRARFDHGPSKTNLKSKMVKESDAMFVPAGTWHNVTNTSRSTPLRLYTLYAPPNHPHERR